MHFNPCLSFLRTIVYIPGKRIHFPGNRIGEAIKTENGQEFIIFRQVLVDAGRQQPERPGAIFRVRFQLSRMSPGLNKLFSLLPIPFFVGLPGFRSKLWMLSEATSQFQGIYEWDTIEHAKKYASSFAMRFMTMRSVPGSISYEILPNKDR